MSEYNQHYIENIKKAIKDDKLVLFVGAGISMESGLPSWNDIIGVFLNELNIDKDSRNLDYLKIAQMYNDEYGSQQYLERINEIFSIHKNAIPNHYHNLIAKINPKHVITTNYDSLLERSLNSGIKKYEVIIEDKDIPYSLGNNYIIKMHGDLSTDFVFKEEDYLNYEENYRMISSIIKSIISNNTVLFIGYSLSDPNFHEIYRYIQKTLGNHARKSYLFLTNDISQAEKSYYMNKGFNVVNSSEANISSDKFVITSKFLESLIDNKCESITNENQLYNNVSFLDLLYFVPYSALQKYSGLKMLVDFSSAKDIGNNCNFNISKNLQLVTFLKEKTMFKDFLNLSEEHIFQGHFKANPYLSEAYQYYLESKWDLATEKFRLEANAAFDRNDYITFLIAEFNIYRLLRGKEKIEISNGKFDGEEFDEIVVKLLESTKSNDKKIINYLKDEVFNFNILYHNYYRISNLCDKIIKEKMLIEGGGSTWNSILLQLEGEFQTLKNFIDINCLCISHYKEFKKMVTKYFEAYLTAFEIGKLELDEDAFASSVITKLDGNILMNIVPYIENEDLRILLKKFENKWIPYTEEGYNYITDQIEINLIKLNKNFMIETENNLKRSLITLSYSKEQNLEKLICIIQNIPLNYLHIFNYEIKLLLNRLLNYIETKELNQEIKDKIASEMEKLVNEIFLNISLIIFIFVDLY
ncbi:SIR2 family protein [Globicatella sp. PHS-GS-PNBC-21-1553]|uniref:SIR2 family protein n=1 Tax=Globicatella sp. PHS-GS-PNBC-21-1553 TaxID=2885764 RepID=UPI00298F3BD9|nr:SIR2 family protein [Globicatella sp. PHS-GS-PNBC-21-1553]WPC08100.1 SIR2 family protein [Globicatella sp. PHS-GS-PNBC-21-1553]